MQQMDMTYMDDDGSYLLPLAKTKKINKKIGS